MNRVKVAFLDRDGTINKEIDHLYKIEDFEFISGVPEALVLLKKLGFKIFIVSNQAGIAKGLYSEKDVMNLHKYIISLCRDFGVEIDGIYYCPHHPEGSISEYSKECFCRKPHTGMIDNIVLDLKTDGYIIDFVNSFIAGDTEKDMLTGLNAGIGTKVLLRCGHSIDEFNTCADFVEDNLLTYVSKLLKGTI